MKLLIKIDQVAALKAGIDAPKSTAEVEFNPANLSPAQCELLAHFVESDGYKTETCAHIDKIAVGYLSLTTNTEDALIEKLSELINQHEEKKAAAIDAAKKAGIELTKRIKNKLENFDNESFLAWVTHGEFKHELQENVKRISGRGSYDYDVCASIKIPYLSPLKTVEYSFSSGAINYVNPELIAEYNAKREELHQKAVATLDALEPELREKLAKLKADEEAIAAARKEKRDKEKQEYTELYNRLPEILRKRAIAGVANGSEVGIAIRTLICKDAGLTYNYESHASATPEMTDEEFLNYEKIIAPEGWEKDTGRVYLNDDEDDTDESGFYKPVALLSTKKAGLEIVTVINL